MPSEEFIADSRPSMWRSSSGELWMATRKGVAVANAAFLSLNEIAPPVVIESFSADNKEVPGASGVPSLPSARARYTFEYAGLSYTIPSKVLYRTKLEGFDSDWSSPTTRRNASYTNLPPGKYTFRVRAANNDGVWNLTGAHVEFRILPPFYRTWWFLLALTVALGCLGLLIYRFRMRRVRLRFEAVLAERGRIAREIHDTLAQDLVGISVQLNLVSQLLDSGKLSEATQQLTLTRRVATEGIEEARQSIWNLRATTGHLDLPSKMTALANRYSTNSLAVRTRVGGAYRELPNAIEDQVLRIMQEAITNARRHASAAEVNVDCQYGHDKLIVKVKDDGRGFTIQSSVAENGHFGLQGMRERAATIGGELNVRSEVGEGTLVELVVPIGQAKGSD
jgi:signal transduction histidine kinase